MTGYPPESGPLSDDVVPLTPPNLSYSDLRSVAFGNPTQGERERVERALSPRRQPPRAPSGIVSVRIGAEQFVAATQLAETADALVEATDAVEMLHTDLDLRDAEIGRLRGLLVEALVGWETREALHCADVHSHPGAVCTDPRIAEIRREAHLG